MKITQILISATLISASALGLGLVTSAFAQETSSKALVTCGHQDAPRIVDADHIPLGCQVLQVPYRT